MEEESEKPMNEEEWFRFMQKSDAKSARFGDLLETLMDHPDCDEIIAREMGWDRDDDDDDISEKPWLAALEEAAEEIAANDLESPFDDDELEKEIDSGELGRDKFDKIPVYALAFEVGLEVHKFLQPFMEKLDVDALDEVGERIQDAYRDSLIPAAKIAGGHGMGYEDRALCGHIVCLRKALDASIAARNSVKSLGQDGHLPRDASVHFSGRLDEVRQALEQRIAELRARVWWQ